jgi:hypothetical protein
MTATTPGGRPADLARDDELLDALGRGELPAGSDEVAVMLSAWRGDLVDLAAREPAGTPLRSAAPAAGPSGPGTVVPMVPGRRRSSRRLRLAAAAAVVVLAAGGTAAAAASTRQDSPLWPVTRLLYPQRAERVAAEDTLGQARQAIGDGRRDDARLLLDKAGTLISQVDDAGDRNRLLAELGQLRQLLASLTGTGTGPAAPGAGPQGGTSGGVTPSGTPSPTSKPLLPNPLPSLLPPSLLPPSLLPSPLLPTSLLPTLPPLPGLGG